MLRRTLLVFALLLGLLSADTLGQSHYAASKEVRVDIVLHSPVQLMAAERGKLRAKIRQDGWDKAEEDVRELYQDKGYLKVEVIPIETPTLSQKTLVFQVNPGKRYHLVRISWRGNAVLSQSTLAKLIPIAPGELFSRRKMAAGLNAVKRLYESQGYINYICIPTPEMDDNAGTVAFDIDVDEGEQFRFGDLDVQGMEEAHRKILLSAWQGLHGRPYNAQDAEEFFKRYFRSPSPNVKPENYAIRKINESQRSVNYSLQFVPFVRYRVTPNSRMEEIQNP